MYDTEQQEHRFSTGCPWIVEEQVQSIGCSSIYPQRNPDKLENLSSVLMQMPLSGLQFHLTISYYVVTAQMVFNFISLYENNGTM